jgi:DNA-binding transcriptional regulator YiaG
MSPLRKMRISKGFFTQDAFAESMGVSKSSVVRWEIGTSKPSKAHRELLEKALELTSRQLNKIV